MDDIQAIRLAKTDLRDAYLAGDLAAALAVFSDNFSDMTAGNASFWGEEAKAVLRHRLEQMFSLYRAELAVTIISISVQGSMAFDCGWHKLKLTSRKSGRSVTKRTRYLEIWQKEADGQWRIAIFMDNADVPPQMPPADVLGKMRGETQAKMSRPPQRAKTVSRHSRSPRKNSK